VTIYEKMVSDLSTMMKGPAEERDALKLIISEMQRGDTKEVSDEKALSILKKLLKDEKEVLELQGKSSSVFMDAILGYLPPAVSDEEMKAFVRTIDFTKLKVPAAALGLIKKKFGDRPFDTKDALNIIANGVN